MRNLTPPYQFIIGCLLASAVAIGLAYIKTHEPNTLTQAGLQGGVVLDSNKVK